MKASYYIHAALVTALICSQARAEDLQRQFAAPLPEFSPVPIWWWSGDRIERDRLRFELERIAAGGIHNAIVLNLAPSGPLYGSAADDPPFLSNEWWDLFGYALKEGKRAGVRLWFYDQLGFSGSGLQARVVRDHPEFRAVALQREVRDVTGPADVEIRTPPGGKPLAAFLAASAESAANDSAAWIWDGAAMNAAVKRCFRRTFDLKTPPVRAQLRITADNGYVAYLNGTKVGEKAATFAEDGWRNIERYDVARHLRAGKNVIAVVGENLGGPGGVLLELGINDRPTKAQARTGVSPKERQIVSDGEFRVSAEAKKDWTAPDFDDSRWAKAHVIGAPPVAPWGPMAGIGAGAGATVSFGTRFESVRNVTDKIADGVLHLPVPAGAHRVQLFYTIAGGFDYHNPAAGAALIDVVHGEMERRFGDELGKGIAGSFQDEFPPMPRFSARFLEEFRKRCGYDLLERLPALYDDVVDRFGDKSGPTVVQIRCDANRVAAELCEEAFFRPLHQWHEKHHLLCGYDQTVRNADPIGGEGYYVDYFKTMRHYSAPGDDQGGDAKPHESIADLYERPRVWLEGFHSSGWGQTPEEIVTLLHPWLAAGSTLYDPHAIYYSTHGSFYEWAPPDTGWRQPYFADYNVLADYVSRLCYILTRGRHVADVAVVHPANTMHAFGGFAQPLPAAQRASDVYWAVQSSLRKEQLDYIIIDEDSIQRAKIQDGVLTVGKARLGMLVLPATRVLGGGTMTKLAEFAASGGTIVIAGESPRYAADRTVDAEKFAQLREAFVAKAVRIDDPAQTAVTAISKFGRDLAQRLPFIHRKVDDRDFYLVLSDDGTGTYFNAEYDINKRKLWENPAAKGARLSVEVSADGIPEQWDAVTGQVKPINNYRRAHGRTWVDLELAQTPAPLIAIRPAKAEEPIAIESALQIVEFQRARDGKTVTVRAMPRLDEIRPAPTEAKVRAQFADATFEGSQPATPPKKIEIPGPMTCRIEPTCDNHYGDFAWPPADGPIPVEVRAFKFREEREGEDASAWKSADFDDSKWDTVIASYGPRASWIGPLKLEKNETIETMLMPVDSHGPIHNVEYSPRLGINEDPIYPTALGGKGRVPEEFIDLGPVKAGAVYLVGTRVNVPTPAGAKGSIPATLRVGGEAKKRVFLNDEEVRFEADPAARVLRATVKLRPDGNELDILTARAADGRLRLFYQFLPAEGVPPDAQWIWSTKPSPTGRTRFVKTINVPGEVKSAAMVVALAEVHKILLNGKLVADQGNFEPYFMGRAERYDITKFLQTGENRLQIDAHDTGAKIGLLLDGLVELKAGGDVPFASDASFTTAPAGDDSAPGTPAQILAGPAAGYLGETATLLLRPRPHPLPEAGWLLNQPPPSGVFAGLTFAANMLVPPPAWYRFVIPPGARAMNLRTPGEAKLCVNGMNVDLSSDKTGIYFAPLPEPQLPRRVAALRINSKMGFARGAAILAPITFEIGPGRIPLGSWDELGLPHYAGAVVYSAQVTLPEKASSSLTLDLGRVRGTAELTVNGVTCGRRLWHPYRFDITDAAKAGENAVEIRIFNTLGSHFGVGHPSWHVFENQTKSGLFGPISVSVVKPVEIRLEKVRQ